MFSCLVLLSIKNFIQQYPPTEIVSSNKRSAMKTILSALALVACFAASAQFPYNPLPFKQSDFKTINAKGYTVLKIYVTNNDSKDLATVVEYGKLGLIATMFDKGTNDNGDTINKTETSYKFDGKGRLVQETINDKESGEDLVAYSYDAAGRLTMKQIATIDPPTYTYKYNAAGKLISAYVTQRMPLHDSADDEWHGKTFEYPANRYQYKYDQKGRLSEEWNFLLSEKSATPTYKTVWTYNDKNQVTKLRRLGMDGSEMSSEVYEYNADGLIKSMVFKNGDEITHYAYEYCKGCKQSWMSSD
jgi:hypothetical protein